MNITILKTKNTNFYINRNKVSGVARKTGSGRKGPSSGSAGGVFLAGAGAHSKEEGQPQRHKGQKEQDPRA